MDNHLLVVRKPAGMLIQGDKSGDISLWAQAKMFLKKEFQKPGNVYLGLVHRLDRPVSGVVIFARTSKAAARLSQQFRKKEVEKIYWALVPGKFPASGVLIDQIGRDGATSYIEKGKAGKKAEMEFRRVYFQNKISLLEINLKTGRHHQIRLQLAHRGYPIFGDFRYGSKIDFPKRTIALHARSISIKHPVKKTKMEFTAVPEDFWPLNQATIASQAKNSSVWRP